MDKATIDEVIDFLKKSLLKYGIQVDSIALFGSALTGNMDKDSDIDLIIISSDFRNLDLFERARLTMIPETDTLRKFKIPMDIINLTPEEYHESNMRIFYKSESTSTTLFSQAMENGIFSEQDRLFGKTSFKIDLIAK